MITSSERPDTEPGHRPAVATACGKVILLGEHSVVYGEPAMAIPLTALRLSVVLASPDRGWVSDSVADEEVDYDSQTMSLPALVPGAPPGLAADGAAPLSIDLGDDAPGGASAEVSRALGTAARALGVVLPLPLRVAVRAGGLRSGMGTSAALGTALARALLAWYGEEPDVARVLQAAGAVERLFHDNPSGIDHTVSALELPVWFEKRKEAAPLVDLPPLELVLRPRRSERSTSDLVASVRDRLVSDPTLVRTVAEMGRATREGRQAWGDGDLLHLGEAMRAQQRALDRLGVVHEVDREGIAIAEAAGAHAAKITGAGWGGTLLALVSSASADAVLGAWGPGSMLLRAGG